ncbi:4Fe-4S dicluster domain-containing protein [Mycolicibacterium sp. ND9-15]|uniref:4Fe-4S dicluster domain-containing protein n=1 Tax=Mycolicibacterium sp. ND9-15 TaxID=3042320 RepID=UPI002DD9C5AF|nr:4Fe-4S dicluster domain-containing protein [Mycolicibacterium sp. ND9-15]WSE55017.1 4Fe-4S dicluster domain-containing protein [Mycolicibacterium sp. ND9-15]
MKSAVIDAAGLERLVSTLIDRGYRVVGPTVSDNAIVLAELDTADDLPRGWGVDVAPGQYRLRRRDDEAVFGHSAGPQSWKQFLHPSRQKLWSSDAEVPEDEPRYAFVGVRGCDLAAIATLDGVLGRSAHPDQGFTGRLARLFVVAVNCTEPGGLCFCASMGTGPAAGPGYDLALTERTGPDGCWYLVEAGSDVGAEVLADLPHREASDIEIDSARRDVAQAADRMGRRMPDGDLRNLLVESRESPHWNEVASRCLTCGNCTMVCPTCFCTSVEDVTDLTGEHAERWMHWASCFEFDFTFVHEGSVRQSGPSRYRHWLTHKLGTWHDQFGMSGCVGCGRCIAWCPTGIDITEEMTTLSEQAKGRDD